jgi:hypothetical protein
MPRVTNLKERRHQPFYDTLIRVDPTTAPSPTVQAETMLFNGTNIGQLQWTNMNVAGMFASDNTYIVLAIRVYLWFRGTSAALMYSLCAHQLFINFTAGDKPQFQGPCWLFPQGGGIWGMDSSTPIACNGVPSAESILKLAKPVPLPARQNFTVKANLYDTGAVSLRTQYLNSSTSIGDREIKVVVDGIHTREVL